MNKSDLIILHYSVDANPGPFYCYKEKFEENNERGVSTHYKSIESRIFLNYIFSHFQLKHKPFRFFVNSLGLCVDIIRC